MKLRPLLILSLLGGASAVAQVGITAPVREFRLPMFAPEGHRVWDLRGQEGERRADGTVRLSGMALRFFEAPQGTTPGRALVEVRSPLAIVYEKDRAAAGPNEIDITGPSYEISGSDWRFEGSAGVRKITIGRDVRVRFLEEMQTILK